MVTFLQNSCSWMTKSTAGHSPPTATELHQECSEEKSQHSLLVSKQELVQVSSSSFFSLQMWFFCDINSTPFSFHQEKQLPGPLWQILYRWVWTNEILWKDNTTATTTTTALNSSSSLRTFIAQLQDGRAVFEKKEGLQGKIVPSNELFLIN